MLRSVGWFHTDVSGLRIGPTIKGQDVQEPFKIKPIRSPETSVRNQPTLRHIPDNDSIQVNRGGSLRS